MNFIKNTTWAEIFNGWKKRESNNPGWIQCATEIKGWPNWESWRRHTATQFNAESREWKIFEFTDPINEVPQILIGPYTGWQSRCVHKNATTFEDLINIPEQYEHFNKHEGVLSILKGLPFQTELIGLIRDDTNQIICVEGHHRATAVAMAKKQGHKIDFGNNITIALAHITKDETPLLDEILKRGSSKNPEK